MGWVAGLFDALVAIPKIIGLVEDFAAQVTAWYVARQTQETLSEIQDALALSLRANTQAERVAAAQAWQLALQRPRVSP